MDPRIKNLKSTTFFGRRFTRQQISDIAETVELFPSNSRNELAKTICVHLNWTTPKGDDCRKAALSLLEQFETMGILKLPEKRKVGERVKRPIIHTERSDPQPLITGTIEDLGPLSLDPVTDRNTIALWNELVDRHHYLGYNRPFGPHVRLLLSDRQGRPLACLMFEAGTRNLASRDHWIGWNDRSKGRHLKLVTCNTRFLLLPWVSVENLGSKTLAMATARIADDFADLHKFRPVLAETYVDTEKYKASSYLGAGWEIVGKTAGRKNKSMKTVLLHPLCDDCKDILNDREIQKKPARPGRPSRPNATDPVAQIWIRIAAAANKLAAEHDPMWMQRRRVLNSLIVILFVFKLAYARASSGYATVLAEFWDQCRMQGIPLPQEKPVAQSSICKARKRVDENLFREVHKIVLNESDILNQHPRIFAIDGSKYNLPRPLINDGFRTPNDGAHYPQGLVSCLYHVETGIPVDFDLFTHENERKAACTHFDAMKPGDIVIFDRGYYSWAMLSEIKERRLNAVFRLKSDAFSGLKGFINGVEQDKIITIGPNNKVRKQILENNPHANIGPLPLRLVKFSPNATAKPDAQYVLGTTMYDQQTTSVAELGDIYHKRWTVEEGYKFSKCTIEVTDFHGRCQRTVRQELYAHVALTAMTRIFTGKANAMVNRNLEPDEDKWQANAKFSVAIIMRKIETLIMHHACAIAAVAVGIAESISTVYQKVRPGRSELRVNKKPGSNKTYSEYKPKKTKST